MKGQLKNINNKLYEVEINKYPNSTIKLADEPFKINMNSEDMFETIKARTATCRIYTSKKLEQLYNSKANDVSIKLTDTDTNTIIFAGYITANIYNQEWLSDNDVIELECTDAISILKYYNYSFINSTDYTNILSIICNLLRKCGVYNTMYVAASVSNNSNNLILKETYIDEHNFFDDDNEKTPWKCDEVLEQILKYYNYSLVIYNNDVYLLDYEYINAGLTEYFKVNIADETYTKVSLSNIYTIDKDSHKDVDTNLSLDDTYNKIIVTCNTYPNVIRIPDFFKGKKLENKEVLDFGNKKYHASYYTNKNWNQLFYNFDGTMATPLGYDHTTLVGMIGSMITREANHWLDKPPAQLTFNNYLYLSTGQKVENWAKCPDYALLSYVSESKVLLDNVDNSKSYLVIKGDFFFNTDDNRMFVNEDEDKSHVTSPLFGYEGDRNILRMIVKVGDKYWNDLDKKWQTEPIITSFKVGEQQHAYANNWASLNGNVTYDMYIDADESYYAIPISNADGLYGHMEITIYNPKPPTFKYRSDTRVFHWVTLKNFEIKILKSDEHIHDDIEEVDEDVVYENVIDEEFVNEFDSINMKVNTQTEKDYSLSSVILNNNGKFEYLKKLKNTVSNVNQIQEKNVIQTWYNHYVKPKNILQLTMNNVLTPYSIVKENNLNSNLIVNNISHDIYNNNITTELIEF